MSFNLCVLILTCTSFLQGHLLNNIHDHIIMLTGNEAAMPVYSVKCMLDYCILWRRLFEQTQHHYIHTELLEMNTAEIGGTIAKILRVQNFGAPISWLHPVPSTTKFDYFCLFTSWAALYIDREYRVNKINVCWYIYKNFFTKRWAWDEWKIVVWFLLWKLLTI